MEQSIQQTRKSIFLFLVITFLLSSIFYFLIIHSGKLGKIYGYGIMWCPGLSALITCRILKLKISGLGWSWGNPKVQLWAYLTPLLYALVAYLIIWLTGWGGFFNKDFITQTAKTLGWEALPQWATIGLYFIAIGLYGLPGSMSTALGEEIGWRGFLTPQLSKLTSYTKTSFTVGIIWAVWHYPILIFGGYNNGGPAWYGLICFTIMVISMTFVFTWFRLKSNSLWTGVLLHASHNLFIQAYFTPITFDTGRSKYFIDEFGAVVPAVCLILAIYFWSRRGELKPAVNIINHEI